MVKKYNGIEPKTESAAFVAENATVIGDVELEEGTSVWYGAVLRGDEGAIKVGENSNIQDNCTVHSAPGYSVEIGKNVTVGHNAVVHGCKIGDNCMVGMAATVMNGAVIGNNSLVAAGALVTEGKVFPENSLLMGVPAKAVRTLSEEDVEGIKENAAQYVALAQQHKQQK